jgi:FHA domain
MKATYSFARKSIVIFWVVRVSASKEAAMIRCQKCGNGNVTSAGFCDECGARLRPARSAASPIQTRVAQDSLPTPMARGLSPVARLFEETGKLQGKPPKITVIARGKQIQEYLIEKAETVIGRWDAARNIFPDIDLEQADVETKISRRHARILMKNDECWVEDLGSLNGTVINRQHHLQQGKPFLLRDGDEIIVGKIFLKFSFE